MQEDAYVKHDRRVFYTGLVIVIIVSISIATYLFLRFKSYDCAQALHVENVKHVAIRFMEIDNYRLEIQTLAQLNSMEDETLADDVKAIFQQYRYRFKHHDSIGYDSMSNIAIQMNILVESGQEQQWYILNMASPHPDQISVDKTHSQDRTITFYVLGDEDEPTLFDKLMELAPYS